MGDWLYISSRNENNGRENMSSKCKTSMKGE